MQVVIKTTFGDPLESVFHDFSLGMTMRDTEVVQGTVAAPPQIMQNPPVKRGTTVHDRQRKYIIIELPWRYGIGGNLLGTGNVADVPVLVCNRSVNGRGRSRAVNSDTVIGGRGYGDEKH